MNIILLYGNDAAGKTTICHYMNQHGRECYTRGSESHYLQHLKQIDDLTLRPVLEESSMPPLLENSGHQKEIFRFILDANIDVLNKRLCERTERDKWESMKALHYFRSKFMHLALYYGIPIVNTEGSVEQSAEEILSLVGNPSLLNMIKEQALLTLTQNKIRQSSLESKLSECVQKDLPIKVLTQDICQDGTFDEQSIAEMLEENLPVRTRLQARYRTLRGNKPEYRQGTYHYELIKEGESKQIFKLRGLGSKFFEDKVFICLKPTIYSHRKQATGEILQLSEVRAEGTKYFLELLSRNQFHHAYLGINSDGVIIANEVEVTPLEVCFKTRCQGTDKYSYHGMLKSPSVCLSTGEYVFGPYIRFDWRNPNHLNSQDCNVCENPYYHVIESSIGKEAFFEKYVTRWKALGDKSISQNLAQQVQDVSTSKKNAMALFLTLQEYLSKMGLELQDGCIMSDRSGKLIWSEINQDCMRIKRQESLDKDIWRAGGSSSKEILLQKWQLLNDYLRDYLQKNPFHNNEMVSPVTAAEKQAKRYLQDSRFSLSTDTKNLFQHLVVSSQINTGACSRRNILLTLDLFDGQPVTVKQGVVQEPHSDGNVEQALEFISVFPDVLVVDLNRALQKESYESSANTETIFRLAKRHLVHAGGGLRTIEHVQKMLQNSVQRVVIGTNTDENFLNMLPKERLIVELTIKDDGVAIFGRSLIAEESISSRLARLSNAGVNAVSLTIHRSEGLSNGINRELIEQLILKVPPAIQKVFIGGGVSSMSDIEYLWTLDQRIIPVIGSAIWSRKLDLAILMQSLIRFDENGLVPGIIQDTNGIVLGLVYFNDEAIQKCVKTRLLHRYSRRFNKVIQKGETSGNVQHIEKMLPDCDADAILIRVRSIRSSPFCHTKDHSCFSDFSALKGNLGGIISHIGRSLNEEKVSYTGHMQRNPRLALAKVMEELWEVIVASDHRQVPECADLLAHLFMYFNGIGIHIDSITDELNARRLNPRLNTKLCSAENSVKKYVIGICKDNYSNRSDEFARRTLGVHIKRNETRSLKLDFFIETPSMYSDFFGDAKITFVPMRPKDMPLLMSYNVIDGAIAYNTIMENMPNIAKEIVSKADDDLTLALLCRQGEEVNPQTWGPDNRAQIVAEHVWSVRQHLTFIGISEEAYSLQRVMGSSESFIVNDTKHDFIVCDGIISSGKTMMENNLQIWQVIKPPGQVKIGLYLNDRHELS